MTNSPSPHSKLDGVNVSFLAVAHLLAVAAVVWLATVRCSGWTIGLGLLWMLLCGFSITGGYHRLFAHRSYEASRILRAVFLLFGAASVQNSAHVWAADHRRHHAYTDRPEDPYRIGRGFLWAHIGWVLHEAENRDLSRAHDLAADSLIAFQKRHYLWLAILFGAVVPLALGFLWGDPIGALLVAGFLRLVIQWHATFAVNSVAHTLGTRPYSLTVSARDSVVTAIVSFGEGYHNFHHRFQRDYRNGIRWYHLDPTKWMLWCFARIGLVRKLRRTPEERILKAREDVKEALRATP